MDISLVTVWATVVKCQENFSFLLSHSWNLKEIEEFSAISYSQTVSSGPSTFQLVVL